MCLTNSLLSSGLAAWMILLLLPSAVCQAPAIPWEFIIPSLSTHRAADRQFREANTTIDFTAIDRRNTTATRCHASWPPSTVNQTFYPSEQTPLACADDAYGWYFASFKDLSDFSINLIHTYVDPQVGPLAETLFGTGPSINTRDVPHWMCRYRQGPNANCHLGYGSLNPIHVPVTAAIAKRSDFVNDGERLVKRESRVRRVSRVRWDAQRAG